MLRRASESLLRLSSAWTMIGVTLVYAWFIATVMPAQSAASRVYAGQWGAPDRQFFYTPAELYAEVANWGADGRADYIGFRLGLDFAWALAYTAFLVVAIGCAARIAFDEQDRRRLLNLAPVTNYLPSRWAGILTIGNRWPPWDAAPARFACEILPARIG